MDCGKIGKLIFRLRTEKNMTQKNLADALYISDRTISKWERGIGCPDVSLLSELSKILGVNIEMILLGDLETNEINGGNMKKIKFYVCPNCGNIIFETGESVVSCCGRIIEHLEVAVNNSDHAITIDLVDGEYFAHLNHEMSKAHFISFAAVISYDRILLIKLYPEQNPEFRFPKMSKSALYIYCNTDGLFKYQVNDILKG